MTTSSIAVPEWRRPVVSVPLTQAFPELGEVKEFRSKVCLLNEDRTKVFDVVSARYQVMPHNTAVDMIVGALEETFDSTVEYRVRSLNGGARIIATFDLPITPIKIGRTDISKVNMLVRNSYDRSWVFSAVLGAFRLICSNGMMIGEKFGALKARHVGGDQDAVLEYVQGMIERAPKLTDTWNEWAETKVSHEGAIELLVGEFPDKYILPVLREELYPMSKWDLYNHLTRFATHDTKSVQRRVEFDGRIGRLFYGSYEEEDRELVE